MDTVGVTGYPDFYERKGSLTLRSDHMNYGRATLNSNCFSCPDVLSFPNGFRNLDKNQAREAEPKEYNISKGPIRDLCKSTYKRIGNVTDGSIPSTTYQDHASQTNLKKDFQEQVSRKPMVTLETLEHTNIDRDTSTPKHGFGSVLPRHNPEYNKYYLETTHKADYKPPDADYVPVPEKLPEFPDLSAAYRRCHSQFMDTADYRRPGRNTWQDESGVYANTHFKRQVFKTTNPIPENVL